jgi:alkyl hydroperoxide reductase subunit AhpC
MALQLGATAPGFHTDTTVGAVNFQDWFGDSRAALVSHPSDHQTPPSASL